MTRDIPSALDTHAWDDATPDPKIMVADGPLVKVWIRSDAKTKNARLFITDGPDGKRERFIDTVPAKGQPKVERLVILASATSVSGQAEKWLADNGIQWAHLETWGSRVRMLSGSQGFRDPKLVRRQAMVGQGMPDHDLGLVINRALIVMKLEGQAWNAGNLLGNREAQKAILGWIDRLPFKEDVEGIRAVEGNAASEYWQAWKGLRINWTGDKPGHPRWQGFDYRETLVHQFDSNKDATDPVNAQLNFVYHIAEIVCIHAIMAAGLEPTLGISHSDQNGRDSFALDLKEVMRPWVDQIVLERLLGSTYRADYFTTINKTVNGKLKRGIIKCAAPLSIELAASVFSHAGKIQPAVQFVTKALSA